MARLFISAAHKSSGKTTLSIGLCAALRARGLDVQPFKKGPDYIDPMWLGQASGNPCYNLDFNTMSAAEVLCKIRQQAHLADVTLIEANKGLYDGMALDGSDSNAALARLTQSPVILVIDTRGMSRGIAPLLLGYQYFDPSLSIAGVILNRVGGARHAAKLREAVEHYTDLNVLGCVQESPELTIEERHLGLMPSNEQGNAAAHIALLGKIVSEQVNLDQVLHIATQARPLTALNLSICQPICRHTLPQTRVKLGICQDAAFGFYYPDDLEALEAAGAELVPINTLTDSTLPRLDGLFIGGGFPETHLASLSANQPLQQQIKQAIEAGLPTYAECGGLMYLSRSIMWQGQTAPMVGVIPGDATLYPKPQGRGIVRFTETEHMPWPHLAAPNQSAQMAHEFHYSRLDNLAAQGRFAYRILRGAGITGEYDGWVYRNLLASYLHRRDTAQYRWVQRFVDFMRQQRQGLWV
ncbi:cobyrinate a,c-diamide synthase [Thiofilum flexile]|uniref:cobyrinate a,c-diamide synthase n=1 Tax=Thiofilum flexile TaxID=125627 RepID=UPI000377F290|nr:cobyrinate a,c-diamide synthase [Thiofilum flexile]